MHAMSVLELAAVIMFILNWWLEHTSLCSAASVSTPNDDPTDVRHSNTPGEAVQ